MVTEDMGKAEALNAFIASATISRSSRQESQGWSKTDVPWVGEDQLRECFSQLNASRSTGPGGVHPWVLSELADGIVRLLSVISD